MTILLTGFEPFGKHTENPSRDIAQTVAREWDAREEIVCEILPVAYDAAGARLTELMDRHAPRLVLMLGLADSAPYPRLERVALNIDDAEIADNEGVLRRGTPIRVEAPLALRASLELTVLQGKLIEAGYAVDVSNHAGAYVCNHCYFEALLAAQETSTKETGPAPACLFVHVPPFPANANEREAYLHAKVRMVNLLVRLLTD